MSAATPTSSCCRRATRSRRSALKATRLAVVRRGKVIAETCARVIGRLGLDGRPGRSRRRGLRPDRQAGLAQPLTRRVGIGLDHLIAN